MIDTQELRDRTLEAAAASIQELTNCRWDDAMDAARAVMELPAIAATQELVDLVGSIENDAGQVPAWLWDRIQAAVAKVIEAGVAA